MGSNDGTQRKITRVDAEKFLLAEFDYISKTAFEAHEDRARVSTFYLVSVGSLVGAFLGADFRHDPLVAVFLALLFFILSNFGLATLLQLARLRQAWYDSVEAMISIKKYATEHAIQNGIEMAFPWMKPPIRDKPWSISFMLAFQVSLLGGFIFGAAVFFAGLAWGYDLWIGAPVAAALFFTGQLFIYKKIM
ncbi:MAG: hypothetical protein FJZ96_15410 [Chloroflexi bacterium]|nr:hypothetical protein [Chloroflexota bacterium]